MSLNVYQKLQKARVELQKQPLKESGNNTFAKYTYMELGDFLPQINAICAEVGLCGVVSFGKEEATLTLVNVETPEEKIIFASPMSTADLKGCHAVQQLGAVQSYLRRYLWVAAFEIVEHDALDATTGKKEEAGSTQQRQQRQQQKAAQDQNQQEVKEPTDARIKLKEALATTFHGNVDEMADALRTYSSFDGKGKDGQPEVKFLTLANLDRPTDNEKMHKWFGSALGKLRKDQEQPPQ